MNTRRLVIALAMLSGSLAHAGEFGNHPATTERSLPAFDGSAPAYGHPASPLTRSEHANHAHPAVDAAAHAGTPALNPDSFIVQPPASVRWTVQPESAVQVAHATR